MRVIAGIHRGRKLLGPKDESTTRPITDRVKTSLFDRLWSMGLLDPETGGVALDIFSGTGSLGIEALSRGIERCVFVEQDRDAISRLQKNLNTLDLANQAEILRFSALRPGWVSQLPQRYVGQVRVAFVDPPYALLREAGGWERLIPLLGELARVAEPDGVLVLRTEKRFAPLPVTGWAGPATYDYGSQALHFYEATEKEG